MNEAQKSKGVRFSGTCIWLKGYLSCRTRGTLAAQPCLKRPASPQWEPPAREFRTVWGYPTLKECSHRKQPWKRLVGLPMQFGYRSVWMRKTATDTPQTRWPRPSVWWRTPVRLARASRTMPPPMARAIFTIGSLARERIEAAVAAAASLPFPFTVTARAECYLVGHPDPFEESVARAISYRDAGADCLYVPGITKPETIGRLVKEVDAPINVVMGLAGSPMSVSQLEDLGVKRISIGGSLARATFGLIRRAAAEIRDHGTFTFADGQVPDPELCQFFSDRLMKGKANFEDKGNARKRGLFGQRIPAPGVQRVAGDEGCGR